jgi:hypothetical protein
MIIWQPIHCNLYASWHITIWSIIFANTSIAAWSPIPIALLLLFAFGQISRTWTILPSLSAGIELVFLHIYVNVGNILVRSLSPWFIRHLPPNLLITTLFSVFWVRFFYIFWCWIHTCLFTLFTISNPSSRCIKEDGCLQRSCCTLIARSRYPIWTTHYFQLSTTGAILPISLWSPFRTRHIRPSSGIVFAPSTVHDTCCHQPTIIWLHILLGCRFSFL